MTWSEVGRLHLRDTPTPTATVIKTLSSVWGSDSLQEPHLPLPAPGIHEFGIESSKDLTDHASGALDSPLPKGMRAVLLTIKLSVSLSQQVVESGDAYLEVALRKKGGVDHMNLVHRVEAVKTPGAQGAEAMAPGQEGFVCAPVQVANGEFEILTIMSLRGPVWRVERTLYVTGFYV